MTDPHCRIRSVTDKATGNRVRVIPRDHINDMGQDLLRDARILAQQPDLAGYFIVVWDTTAGFNCGCRIPDGPVPITLFPAWIEEIARRKTVTTREVHDIIDRDYVHPPRQPS